MIFHTPSGEERRVLLAALDLIGTVPGYAATAEALRRARLRYDPRLADRAQTSLRGVITLGPEPFAGTAEAARVGLAGTLIHEHTHTRQHPFLKTRSVWAGVLTGTAPMGRYERPAYQRQADFLQALADAHPSLRPVALRERAAALASFAALYGAGSQPSE